MKPVEPEPEIPTYVMHPKGMTEPPTDPLTKPKLTPLEVKTPSTHPTPPEISWPTVKPEPKPEPLKSCWRQAYARGAGEDSGCTDNQEMGFNGCYPKCSEGNSGAGVFCSQDCPADFKNFAYYCMKPAGYWRGTGKSEPFEGSEKFALLYYP